MEETLVMMMMSMMNMMVTDCSSMGWETPCHCSIQAEVDTDCVDQCESWCRKHCHSKLLTP